MDKSTGFKTQPKTPDSLRQEASQADHGSGPELRSFRGGDEVGGITGDSSACDRS